jgi:hypothetical protein
MCLGLGTGYSTERSWPRLLGSRDLLDKAKKTEYQYRTDNEMISLL